MYQKTTIICTKVYQSYEALICTKTLNTRNEFSTNAHTEKNITSQSASDVKHIQSNIFLYIEPMIYLINETIVFQE